MSEVSATPASAVVSSTPSAAAPEAKVSGAPVDNPTVVNGSEIPSSSESPDKGREDVNFSARFAALTKREKDLIRRQQEKDREVAEKLKALEEPDFVTFRSAKQERNVIKALQALGFKDLHEAAQFIANDGKLTPEQEIAAIKQKLEEKEAAERELAEKSQAEYIERVFGEVQRQIDAHLDTSGDTYELIRLNGANSEVLALIEEHFKATEGKEVLSIEQACAMVEKYYEDEAKKLLQAKKFAPKVTDTPSPASVSTPVEEPKTVQGSKTLTNASVIAAPSKPTQTFLSDEESKAAAAEFLRKALEAQARA
jgi:hypothetical protein